MDEEGQKLISTVSCKKTISAGKISFDNHLH